MEDTLFSLPAVKSLLSSSENGQVRFFIRGKSPAKDAYMNIREAAERVYQTLHRSAQRPEILFTDEARIPIWTAAVFADSGQAELSVLLERVVKPALQSIEGTG